MLEIEGDFNMRNMKGSPDKQFTATVPIFVREITREKSPAA